MNRVIGHFVDENIEILDSLSMFGRKVFVGNSFPCDPLRGQRGRESGHFAVTADVDGELSGSKCGSSPSRILSSSSVGSSGRCASPLPARNMCRSSSGAGDPQRGQGAATSCASSRLVCSLHVSIFLNTGHPHRTRATCMVTRIHVGLCMGEMCMCMLIHLGLCMSFFTVRILVRNRNGLTLHSVGSDNMLLPNF